VSYLDTAHREGYIKGDRSTYMSSPIQAPTIRRSVALPSGLVKRAQNLAPAPLRNNFNRLVREALEEFIRSREARAFEESMTLMARDPAIRYECGALERGFLDAEGDGLEDGA
jgi:hypothetical protein